MTRKTLAFFLMLLAALPTAAVEDGHVVYAGGTVPGLRAGIEGHLDTTLERPFRSSMRAAK